MKDVINKKNCKFFGKRIYRIVIFWRSGNVSLLCYFIVERVLWCGVCWIVRIRERIINVILKNFYLF